MSRVSGSSSGPPHKTFRSCDLHCFSNRSCWGGVRFSVFEKEWEVMRRALKVMVIAAAAIASAPGVARADGYFVPWAAANAGNGLNFTDNGRASVGVIAG